MSIATDPSRFGDTDNTLLLKWATLVQGGAAPAVPVNTSPPTITGPNNPPVVGDTQTAHYGSWTNNPLLHFLQWYRDDVAIAGEVFTTYVASSDDIGHTIKLGETVSNAVGISLEAFSSPTGTVVAADPLAGITFALRLQTHSGFGATPNAPVGLFQDVACTVPATMDGDPIAAWKDVLGTSGLKATQSDAAKQPILVFESGVPTILFDGVDDFLATSAFAVSQPFTNFIGWMVDGASPTQLMTDGLSSGSRVVLSIDTGPIVAIYGGTGNVGYSHVVPFAGYILTTGIYNGASSAIHENGTSEASGNAGSNDLDGLTIGARFSGTFPTNGAVVSALVMAGISAPNQATTEAYLEPLNP